jgi:hypothetical protein
MMRGRSWNELTGTIVDVQEIGREIMARSYPLEECVGEDLIIKMIGAQGAKISLEVQLAYDGTPGSVAPDAPDTKFDVDSGDTTDEEILARRAALCDAVNRYVRGVFQTKADQLRAGGLTTAAAGAIVALVNIPLGIIAVATSLSLEALASAFEDATAIEDVVCCMYSDLQGRQVTEAGFRETPADCGFSFPDNNAQLAGYLRNANQHQEHYLMFLRELGEAFRRAMIDQQSPEECLCEGPCLQEFDFEGYGRQGWYLEPSHPQGDWASGSGFRSTLGDDNEHRLFIRKNCSPGMEHTDAEVEYTYYGPSGQGSAIYHVGYDSDMTELFASAIAAAPGRNTGYFTGDFESADVIAFEVRSDPADVEYRVTIHRVAFEENP